MVSRYDGRHAAPRSPGKFRAPRPWPLARRDPRRPAAVRQEHAGAKAPAARGSPVFRPGISAARAAPRRARAGAGAPGGPGRHRRGAAPPGPLPAAARADGPLRRAGPVPPAWKRLPRPGAAGRRIPARAGGGRGSRGLRPAGTHGGLGPLGRGGGRPALAAGRLAALLARGQRRRQLRVAARRDRTARAERPSAVRPGDRRAGHAAVLDDAGPLPRPGCGPPPSPPAPWECRNRRSAATWTS